jgi:hypothetical protein
VTSNLTPIYSTVRSAVVKAAYSHGVLEHGAGTRHNVGRVHRDDSALARVAGVPLALLQADLFDVAVAVSLVDRATARPRARYGRGPSPWRRQLDVTVPVREPERWRSPEVTGRLEDALSFLTEDEWRLRFVTHSGERRPSEAQGHLFPALSGPVRVALHSGGLDSFAGAAIDLADHAESDFILVSGVSSTRVGAVQRQLARALATRTRGSVSHVAFRYGFAPGTGRPAAERTQRTRGFLFTAIGAAAALAAGTSTLFVYENGVGAINLPYDGTHLGTAGTRAMHPVALLKMSRFVEALAGAPFSIENPFLAWTKAEMCAHPALDGLEHSLSTTVSCESYPIRRRGTPECGSCTSCILRRESLAAGGRASADPAGRYVRDVKSPAFERETVRRRSAWDAMNRQADVLRARLAAPDPWLALTQEYPDLRRIEAELVSASLAGATTLRGQILGLLSRHVDQWSAFTAGAPERSEERAA